MKIRLDGEKENVRSLKGLTRALTRLEPVDR